MSVYVRERVLLCAFLVCVFVCTRSVMDVTKRTSTTHVAGFSDTVHEPSMQLLRLVLKFMD